MHRFLSGECEGCRSNKGLSIEYQKYCKIYKCATSKNLDTCLNCENFPCKFFDFFKSETLESSAWFLDVWCNMKQVKEYGVSKFLRAKEKWLERRKSCAAKRGIKYCDECKQWPCELLKREVSSQWIYKSLRNTCLNLMRIPVNHGGLRVYSK